MYGKEKGYTVILDSRVILFGETSADLTDEIIKVLNSRRIAYTILTKSPYITDYLNLIKANTENDIYFTLNLSSDQLIRFLEDNSPKLNLRIEAIKSIIASGISLRIHIGPFIPYISSLKKIIACLPEGIRKINVELYHHKQGNFEAVIKRIEEKMGKKLKVN